jgi:CO/xanthine dehydrogenase Mo-binding subunit
VTQPLQLTRRTFFKAGLIAGISVYIAPWGQQAFAELFEAKLLTPVRWDPRTNKTAFRIDGIAKVTGRKIFAQDIRARDMPHWPAEQSHALIVRIPCADRIYLGMDMHYLGDDLQPDHVVTAKDLERDGIVLPEFYGSEPFLAEGRNALYLGHPVAMLIYRDFARFNRAKAKLKYNEAQYLRYGETVPFRQYDPYASMRYVRVAGTSRQGPDVYSSIKDTAIFGHYLKHKTVWPEALRHGKLDAQGMAEAQAIEEALAAPSGDWLVMTRQYASQSIDHVAMEPDNANGWYDADQQALHLVIASQSPAEVAASVASLVSKSRFRVKSLFVHPCHTVGYGSKDHSIFPLYGAIAALYGASLPTRLSNDRYEQFQSTMKRHAFDITRTIAVDKKTGLFQILRTSLVGNGGGRENFSASVAGCAATASQSVYYFPRSDIDVVCNYSRAVEAGSMRGYGTLQSMTATEMMVDELAQDLNLDPIELRLRNALHSGDLNTQGITAGGAERIVETLKKAQQHPIWRDRAQAKAGYEAEHPGQKFGVGFACVQKDFGTGAESSFAKVEIDPQGRITLYHSCTEIGTGMSTSQAVNCAHWLGRPAETVHTSLLDWQDLPLKTSGDPYLMSQADQERLSRDPLWTPALASGASASNSAYFNSHTTLEACRLILRHGLWPAAMAIWGAGPAGGQASSYVVRCEDARWTPEGLTADGLEPLPLERLAAEAHARGLITGAMVHAFNRWQWAEAGFDIDGQTERLPLDGVSIRNGLDGYRTLPRQQVFYPLLQRNFAGVTYYSVVSALVELAVEIGTGTVTVLRHHHVVDCGRPIVPELVHGQLQGGVAMGIGHALYEYMPLYEDGPGNGTWNLNRYHVPRASEVAVWNQSHELLPPLSETDPSKGIAEVVMIPIIPAIANAIHHATGQRFYDLPVTPEKIREQLS